MIGVNFYKKFLGGGDAFGCVLRHIEHIIKVGERMLSLSAATFTEYRKPRGWRVAKKCRRL